MLTGESRTVSKNAGGEVLSGAAATGTALLRVTVVGADGYAARLTARVKEFRCARSDFAGRRQRDSAVSGVRHRSSVRAAAVRSDEARRRSALATGLWRGGCRFLWPANGARSVASAVSTGTVALPTCCCRTPLTSRRGKRSGSRSPAPPSRGAACCCARGRDHRRRQRCPARPVPGMPAAP